MADVKIRVIGEDKASATLQGIDKSLGGLKQGLSGIASTATAVTGAVAIVGMTIKKAFDLGAEGAAVTQTAESFDLLMSKVGAAPDMLDRLRDASKGTIPDMQLMSSTATLLAGASGDLALSMSDAAPRILEIAKAANKLNPTLGDTTFLYQSLMTGIKRGSPMLIDNTGLTLKLGEANEKYAASLGKSVEQLTADEQKQAILSATLDAGKTLLEQVGDNTDSATDSYAKLQTASENLTNQLKAELSDAMLPLIKALLVIVETHDKLTRSLKDENQVIIDSSGSFEGYYLATKKQLEAHGYFVKLVDGEIVVLQRQAQIAVDVTKEFDLMSQAEWKATEAAKAHTSTAGEYENLADSINKTSSVIITGAEASKYAAGYAELSAAKHITLAEATKKLKEEEMDRMRELVKLREAERDRMKSQLLEVSIAGQLRQAYNDYTDAVAHAKESNAALVEEFNNLVASGEATEEQLDRIRDSIRENDEAQREALATMKKTTAEMIYQQTANGLSSEAALVLARGLGLVSEQDYNLIVQLQALKVQFDANRDGMVDASEGAALYTEKIIEMYRSIVQTKSALMDLTNYQKQLSETGATTTTTGVGAGMVDMGGGIYTYTAPDATTISDASGIYVGGPGEVIGPGVSVPINITYTNNGVTLDSAAALQQLLQPIVEQIIADR